MPDSRPALTVKSLQIEAALFAARESAHGEAALYGVDNGKTIGTYLDQKFQTSLLERYDFPRGNAAKGIDLPGLNVDIKVTSIRQPQSSCPFRSARQKVYGLGYSLSWFLCMKNTTIRRPRPRG